MNRRAGLRLARGLSWTQVTEIGSSDDLGRFGRTASELARYQRHKSAVLQEWASMSDFLCAEIFDVAPVLDADGVSPLHWAAMQGARPIVAALLRAPECPGAGAARFAALRGAGRRLGRGWSISSNIDQC